MTTSSTGDRLLVLITGTGRSGTSTMSGTFHHLGLEVPGPYIGANDSNPKGFYESRWAVRFHNALAKRAGISIVDSRPDALARARRVVTPEVRDRLRAFLETKAAGHDQVVVKDPRTIWFQQLWRETAADAGLQIRYVSMLRHPAEVLGSRATYYSGHAEPGSAAAEADRRRHGLINLARWINGSVINERETRGFPRAFVRYTDLLDDWRTVVGRLGSGLGLRYRGDLSAPHPIDEFIDPGLRRHTVTWDELDLPEDLCGLAQEVWDALGVLADAGGIDAGASARLDECAERYARLLFDAEGISQDRIIEAGAIARAAADAAAARKELSGRELVRELGDRVRRRLRRSA